MEKRPTAHSDIIGTEKRESKANEPTLYRNCIVSNAIFVSFFVCRVLRSAEKSALHRTTHQKWMKRFSILSVVHKTFLFTSICALGAFAVCTRMDIVHFFSFTCLCFNECRFSACVLYLSVLQRVKKEDTIHYSVESVGHSKHGRKRERGRERERRRKCQSQKIGT